MVCCPSEEACRFCPLEPTKNFDSDLETRARGVETSAAFEVKLANFDEVDKGAEEGRINRLEDNRDKAALDAMVQVMKGMLICGFE